MNLVRKMFSDNYFSNLRYIVDLAMNLIKNQELLTLDRSALGS